MKSVAIGIQNLLTKSRCSFGGFCGPYNPYLYKDYMVPRSHPTNKEVYTLAKNHPTSVSPPVRNMRHINPVRQSGPLPPYSGTYTMQDYKQFFDQTNRPLDIHYTQMDVDELMRRVPGITRRQADYITKLGTSPMQQLDKAWFTYHMGMDLFYQSNQVYIARQVVTNSKGQKVEVYWNYLQFEDMSLCPVGFAPTLQPMDYHWQIFLWADPPIKVTNDLDLTVPNTWYEYEQELSTEMVIAIDQMNLPETIRPFDTGRNPNARKELFKTQEQLALEEELLDPQWKLPQTA